MTPNALLIQTLRNHVKMTQLELAQHAGLSLTTVTQLEAGKIRNPTLSTITAVANVLEVSPLQLLWTATPVPGNHALAEQYVSALACSSLLE